MNREKSLHHRETNTQSGIRAGVETDEVMTLKQLRAIVAKYPPEFDDAEIKVWLPGSTIRLDAMAGGFMQRGTVLLLEGNIDPGSALMEEP